MRGRLGGEGDLLLDGRSGYPADYTVVGDVGDCLDGRRKKYIPYFGGTDTDVPVQSIAAFGKSI
jgi:hypothetical protein